MQRNSKQKDVKKSMLNATLDVYTFMDGKMHIAYCPAMDLSSYGSTEEEAKNTFVEVLNSHISYCVNKNTLASDLKAHGWTLVKGKKAK
jgi:hypothetical protein